MATTEYASFGAEKIRTFVSIISSCFQVLTLTSFLFFFLFWLFFSQPLLFAYVSEKPYLYIDIIFT